MNAFYYQDNTLYVVNMAGLVEAINITNPEIPTTEWVTAINASFVDDMSISCGASKLIRK